MSESLSNISQSNDLPPPLSPALQPTSSSPRNALVVLLNLCLALFLADAVVSLADASSALFFHTHALVMIQGIVLLLSTLVSLIVYVAMAFNPAVPKRVFLPITLFNPVTGLIVIPFLILFYDRMTQLAWIFAVAQVVIGFGMLHGIQRGFNFRWPLIAENQLESRPFRWRNFSIFVSANLFLLLPAVAVYLAFCAALAVNHFSGGFMSLHPGGMTVQVRKYVRADCETVELFPMAHVGDASFYQKVSQSFPSSSVILMEGVSDDQNLLTNKISYKRMAKSLGLAEQHEEFNPTQGELVMADVDVSAFTTNTIDLLNLIMLFHAKGVNAETVSGMMQYSPPPYFEQRLMDDLIKKRNQHLLEEMRSQLTQSKNIMIPWGVAHMPGIAQEIQKEGFRLKESHDYTVIRFHSDGSKNETEKTKAGQ